MAHWKIIWLKFVSTKKETQTFSSVVAERVQRVWKELIVSKGLNENRRSLLRLKMFLYKNELAENFLAHNRLFGHSRAEKGSLEIIWLKFVSTEKGASENVGPKRVQMVSKELIVLKVLSHYVSLWHKRAQWKSSELTGTQNVSLQEWVSWNCSRSQSLIWA